MYQYDKGRVLTPEEIEEIRGEITQIEKIKHKKTSGIFAERPKTLKGYRKENVNKMR